MLKLTEDTRIYVADKPVDGRKAINGLAALVVEEFEKQVNDGSVYPGFPTTHNEDGGLNPRFA
jgi:transposase